MKMDIIFPLPIDYQTILMRIAELTQEVATSYDDKDTSVENSVKYLIASDSLKLLQIKRKREFHKLVQEIK